MARHCSKPLSQLTTIQLLFVLIISTNSDPVIVGIFVSRSYIWRVLYCPAILVHLTFCLISLNRPSNDKFSGRNMYRDGLRSFLHHQKVKLFYVNRENEGNVDNRVCCHNVGGCRWNWKSNPEANRLRGWKYSWHKPQCIVTMKPERSVLTHWPLGDFNKVLIK